MGHWSTRKTLTAIFQRAMDVKKLPGSFETAIDLVAKAGLPPVIFKYLPPIRTIVINENMHRFLGVYFGERLECTPISQPAWKTLGWDGYPHMMIFSTKTPEEWVILHELGHYLDDTFVRAVALLKRGITLPLIYSPFNFKHLDDFFNLLEEMRREYETINWMANHLVGHQSREDWWEHIPNDFIKSNAPSQYACISFEEWFAESFQSLLLNSACSLRIPKTTAFFNFFLSEKMFEKPRQGTMCPPMPELMLSSAASK
jgi:hypothetical protein